MSYIKEFVYPFLPIVFEIICRIIFQRIDNWAFYVSPSTIFVTFAIWSSLTSLRVPQKSPVDTDEDYQNSIDTLRQSIMILGIFGFMCFGAFVFGDSILPMTNPEFSEIRNYIQVVFCVVSLIYAVLSFAYIATNRGNIEELYRA